MESFKGRSWRTLLVVLAAGLFVRVCFVIAHQRPLVSDELEYDQLALSIADSTVYANNGTPTAYRPIGYPAFLAIPYTVFGHQPLCAKLLQAFLDTLTAYLLFLIGRIRSERIGFASAVIWSFFVPAILYVNLLLSESLAVFLLVLSLLFFLRARRQASIPNLSVFGLLLGLALLVKPSLLLFPLFLVALFAKMSLSLRQAIFAVVLTIAVILPWMTRNFIVLDTFSLSTNGGMNLYIGNNPDATGAYRGSFPQELSDPSLDEVTRNQEATRLAVEYIITQPGAFVLNGMKKLVHVFRSEGDVLIGSFSRGSAHEHAGFKAQYRSVPILLVGVTNISAFLLLLAGMTGFMISERDRLFWFTAAFLVASLTVHFVFFGGSRFHFPFMPFAAIFASNAVVLFPEYGLKLTHKKRLLLYGGFIALAGIWSYEFYLTYYHTS